MLLFPECWSTEPPSSSLFPSKCQNFKYLVKQKSYANDFENDENYFDIGLIWFGHPNWESHQFEIHATQISALKRRRRF